MPPEPLYDRPQQPVASLDSPPFEAESSPPAAEQIDPEDAAAPHEETGATEGEEVADAILREDSGHSPPVSQGHAGVKAVDSAEAGGREQESSDDDPTPQQVRPPQTPVELSPAGASAEIEPKDGAPSPGGDVLGTFEANYAFGIQSYDESFTISGPDGELLGACGMGMNESLDREAADTDQVRLLEIWLYDRSAVRSISRLLVSPGFDATLHDDRNEMDGSNRSPPLELASGLTCRLRSHHIQLDCAIKNVSYLDSGQSPRPLRSVSAALVVRSPV